MTKRGKFCFAAIAVLLVALAYLAGGMRYERPVAFERPLDLNRQDCRVGVLGGYESEAVARRVYTLAQIVPFDDFEDAFTALLAGIIDGFVYSDHVLNVGLRSYPNRFKILDEALAETPAVVLLSPQRGDLLPLVNRFISNCRQSGVYDDMLARWCQSDVFMPMPEIAEPDATNGVLRIGTSGEEEPSSYVDRNGELVGFDIEFARRFALFAGLKPEIECRPDGLILKELEAGQLDLVIDNYTVNEAIPGVRASDDYFDSQMKVLVRSGDESRMMLGSTSLGQSKGRVGDPRVTLLSRGVFTTLVLSLAALALGMLLLVGYVRLVNWLSPLGREIAVLIAKIFRFIPPPVLLLIGGTVWGGQKAVAYVAVLVLAIGFVAAVEPSIGETGKARFDACRRAAGELVKWTSVAGLLYLCDLTFAVDIICGRNPLAFGPLVSVAAAYCFINFALEWVFDVLERRRR